MNNILANFVTLANFAERTFGNSATVIAVHTYNLTISVQMRETDMRAWCEARGLTPNTTMRETEYAAQVVTHRHLDAVVAEVEGGRLVLVACEVADTRPTTAPAPLQGEGESAAA